MFTPARHTLVRTLSLSAVAIVVALLLWAVRGRAAASTANSAPVANADTATAVEAGGTNNGTPGTDISGYNVITGVGTGSVADTDPDAGDTLTIQGILDGNQGSTPITGNVGAGISANAPNDYGVLTMHSDGSYNYVVNQNNATVQALRTSSDVIDDVFTYTLRDAAGATSNATITIHITGADDAPVAVSDSYSTNEDTALSVTAANGVLANDTDVDTAHSSLTASIVSQPSHASSFTLNSDGSFSYTPSAGYNGSDSFQYKANDGALDSNTVTVSLTVNAVPDLSVNDVSQAEGNSGTSTFDFTVSLDSPAGAGGVGFDVSTADGAAKAGSDYVAVTNQHYTITQGQSSTTVSVTVNGDTTPETNETFFVNITNVTGAQVADSQGQGTIQNDDAVAAGSAVVSEFRFRGPNGSRDEFVELSNQTDSDLTVATTDNSAGWALVSSDAPSTAKYVVPAGTVIPARGHFLIANAGTNGSDAYSLGLYAPPDTDANNNYATYTGDIPDDGGVAIYSTADPNSFGDSTRLDAVGFTASAGFYEGTPVQPATTVPGSGIKDDQEFSFLRDLRSSRPKDTNVNSADFILVATHPELLASCPTCATLGAPGPEGTFSLVNRGDVLKARLVDATVPSSSAPNRDRNTTPYTDTATPSSPAGIVSPTPAPYALGTFMIRRRFVNNSSDPVTALRFRIVDITTAQGASEPPTGTADLRALSSPTATVTVQSHDPAVCGAQAQTGCAVTLKGLSVEQPPTQTRGGGLNTSLRADLSTNPIAALGAVNVEFRFGVVQSGSFRFFVIVEAAPGVPTTQAAPAKSDKYDGDGSSAIRATAPKSYAPPPKQR